MDPVVTDNAAAQRWEITLEGTLVGYATYELQPGSVTILHTVVDPAHEGRGLASRLVATALDDARGRGLAVLPACPYVRAWLARHPDQVDVVPVDRRAGYGL